MHALVTAPHRHAECSMILFFPAAQG